MGIRERRVSVGCGGKRYPKSAFRIKIDNSKKKINFGGFFNFNTIILLVYYGASSFDETQDSAIFKSSLLYRSEGSARYRFIVRFISGSAVAQYSPERAT